MTEGMLDKPQPDKTPNSDQHNHINGSSGHQDPKVKSTGESYGPSREMSARRLRSTNSEPVAMVAAACTRSSPYDLAPLVVPIVCPYEKHDIPQHARGLQLYFAQSGAPRATAAYELLRSAFVETFPNNLAESSEKADIVVSLGGDGFLLETIRAHPQVPVYGINCGHVGFLSNKYRERERMLRLLREVDNAHPVKLPFLQVTCDGGPGFLALNEVVVSRSTMQAANMSVTINGQPAVPFLAGDGLLVSTPAGSTAYNLSAGGSILPLEAQLLALTPICPFRPRRMESVLLDIKDVVLIQSLGAEEKRPVRVAYDGVEIPRNATKIEVRLSDSFGTLLLDDASKHRIFMERFKQES